MPCLKPIEAWYSKTVNPSGKRSLVFNRADAYDVRNPVHIPCGQCIACRLEKSRQWATRCVLESQLHQENCFLTLTYNDDFLPSDLSLHKEHLQLFMKRLRRKLEYYGFLQKVRFFAAGEYGSLFERPHYHIILFGFRPHDLKRIGGNKLGNSYYSSQFISDIWPYGYNLVADVSFESCAYVARYCTKKITGEAAEEHYQGRLPEFTLMSRRPGIASAWLDKYFNDVYPRDYVVVRGDLKIHPPKFFDRILERDFPDLFAKIKDKRLNDSLISLDQRLDEYSVDVSFDKYSVSAQNYISYQTAKTRSFEDKVLPVLQEIQISKSNCLRRRMEEVT